MRLMDYLGLYRKWPPGAHDPTGAIVDLDHCLDILIFASIRPTGQHTRVHVHLLTEYQHVLSMREILDADEIFARVLCGFLNKHRGVTIREIGEIDVSFLA